MKLKLTILLAVVTAIAMFAGGCGSVPENATASAAAPSGAATPSSESKLIPSSAHNLVPDQINVPAGTAVSIRLQSGISSASSRTGDEFSAVLDEPIVVNGQTVASRGAGVRGRVLAARSSGRLHNSGYLRLS